MTLSILIPTIFGREEKFEKLLAHLNSMITPSVEILIEKDNKEISIGKKRQKLLTRAIGEWIVFIDDDDWVSNNYVEKILEALSTNPDSVGFKIQCSGTKGVTAACSNRWRDWADQVDGFDYVRTPYHKVPIRRKLALQIGFNDIRFGEDYDFSKRLKEKRLIETEFFIDEILYYYRFSYENPKTKFNIK